MDIVIVCLEDKGGWINIEMGIVVGEGKKECIGLVKLKEEREKLLESKILRNRLVEMVVIINKDESDIKKVIRWGLDRKLIENMILSKSLIWFK